MSKNNYGWDIILGIAAIISAIALLLLLVPIARAQTTISNLPPVVTPAATDLFWVDQVNPQSPTGYSSRKETSVQLATLIGGGGTATPLEPSVPGARMTPLTVTTGGATGTLPTGDVVVISNVGTTNPMYCNVVGISPATTSDQPIAANYGWFAFTIPTGVTALNCISTGGNTTANGLGGTGLPTGTGGGSGGGTSGSVTQGSPPWEVNALLGDFAAGWAPDIGNVGSVTPWHNTGGGTPNALNILAGMEADLVAPVPNIAVGGAHIASSQFTCTTTSGASAALALRTGVSGTGRIKVTVINTSTTIPAYVGPTGVATGTGALVPIAATAGQGTPIELPTTAALFCITGSSTAVLTFLETY